MNHLTVQENFILLMSHPIKSRMYLFFNLPSAFFSGVRLKKISVNECSVSVPYKWFSKNPFRSTYFACLAMAAEMSTGVLALMNIYKTTPQVSMLVVKLEAQYFKKATGKTIFVCKDGAGFSEAIRLTKQNGEPVTFVAKSIGYNEQDEVVAEFLFTWSFKAKIKSN